MMDLWEALATLSLLSLGCAFVIYANNRVIRIWAESGDKPEIVLFWRVLVSTAWKMGILGLVGGVFLSAYLCMDDSQPRFSDTLAFALAGSVLGACAGFLPAIAAIWGSYYSPRRSMLFATLTFLAQIGIALRHG